MKSIMVDRDFIKTCAVALLEKSMRIDKEKNPESYKRFDEAFEKAVKILHNTMEANDEA